MMKAIYTVFRAAIVLALALPMDVRAEKKRSWLSPAEGRTRMLENEAQKREKRRAEIKKEYEKRQAEAEEEREDAGEEWLLDAPAGEPAGAEKGAEAGPGA